MRENDSEREKALENEGSVRERWKKGAKGTSEIDW